MSEEKELWQRALEERQRRRDQAAARAMSRAMEIEPTARGLLHQVAVRFDVPVREITGPSRLASIQQARLATYWLLRERGMSTPEIGRAIGGRDHTTVIAGLRRVARLRLANPKLAGELDALLVPITKVRVRVRVGGEGARTA